MAINSIKFVGNCAWEQSNFPVPVVDRAGGISIVVKYRGRFDQLEDFRARFRLGMECRYIDVAGRDIVFPGATLSASPSSDEAIPFPTLTLTYTGRDPQANDPQNQYQERTVEKTATITADITDPVPWTGGKSITAASTTITYRTQEASVVVYSNQKPTGPGPVTKPGWGETKIRSQATTITYTLGGESETIQWPGSLPTEVSNKLKTTTKPTVDGLNIRRMTGTPWWEMSYATSNELVGPNG